ncbi:hypothetical protein O1L60_24550 [Streptomyces diastatochromogenes]|nr:hypothetical protein [Streptomyces diastatochromogenes]
MLVHVSAANDRVEVVSLPRDSLASFPAGHRDRRTGEVHPPTPRRSTTPGRRAVPPSRCGPSRR